MLSCASLRLQSMSYHPYIINPAKLVPCADGPCRQTEILQFPVPLLYFLCQPVDLFIHLFGGLSSAGYQFCGKEFPFSPDVPDLPLKLSFLILRLPALSQKSFYHISCRLSLHLSSICLLCLHTACHPRCYTIRLFVPDTAHCFVICILTHNIGSRQR